MNSFLDRPILLGIETSCDDTACAVVDGAGRVLASAVSSQLEAHRPFGGVVPEIASREHLGNWPGVCRQALEQAGLEIYDIDVVAATRGPGLIGSLLVGLSVGRSIAFGLERPFHGIHHLEGHLYSPFLSAAGEPAEEVPERFTGLVVSGGHTSLLAVGAPNDQHDETLQIAGASSVASLVESRDDAMGEVFDKVGKRLGLPYPQGPLVDQLAERGRVSKVMFKVPVIKDELFFSYSGLKSQALREIQSLEARGVLRAGEAIDAEAPPQPVLDLLASFRYSAVRQIIDRLRRLRDRRRLDTLAVSGGVAANRLLRRELVLWAEQADVNLRLVPLTFAGDNAAMIAFAALVRQRRGVGRDPSSTVVASRIPFAPAAG